MSARHARPAALPGTAVEIVASLAVHRALTSRQVRVVHLPEVGERRCRHVLSRIAAAGLIDGVVVSEGGPRRSLWFVTEAGARMALEAGLLDRPPRVFDAREIAGPLRAHTEAVNEAAISFLRSARERGEEFGPLGWRNEVAHPLAEAVRRRRPRAVIADAVLSYVRATTEGRASVAHRFLELDRATLAVDAMATELARYADLARAQDARGEPIWRERYPAFPSVVCVLAGAGRQALLRRRDVALALLRSEPQLTRTPEVEIRICLLEDLVAQGPKAPIFRSLRDPGKAVDWLGNRQEEDDG